MRDRDRDERPHRLRVGEHGHAVRVPHLHVLEERREHLEAVLAAEAELVSRRVAEELPDLTEVVHPERPRNERPTGPQHSTALEDRLLERLDVVEHPPRDHAVEAFVLEGERLDVADPARRLHARRVSSTIRGDRSTAMTLDAELRLHPLGELARPAADLEHTPRRHLGDHVERDVLAVRPLDELPVRGVALGEPLLARVLPRDDQRVVELQGATIGCPGIPFDGALPPNHALTVAPTSANSPS